MGMAGGYGTPSRHEGTLFFGLSHDIQWLKQGTPGECSPGGEDNFYLGRRSESDLPERAGLIG